MKQSATDPTATLITQFEHYIQALLAENPHSQQTLDPSTKVKPALLNSKNILWIVSQPNFCITERALKNKHSQCIAIEALTPATLTQKYALTCFWLPDLTAKEFSPHLPTLIRCRDLYSQYTIAVLNAAISLRPYGFAHLAASPLSHLSANLSSTSKLPQHTTSQPQAWQFNLYDYKPRPQWFNADYWANPENWDKFRW